MSIEIGSVLGIADIARVADGLGAAVRVGIDGPGASGKSTLAAGLAEALPRAVLVNGDDFYRPEADEGWSGSVAGGLFDLPRLASQVLVPHSQGEEIQFQRFNWDTEILGDWVSWPGGTPLIVDGVYSTHEMLRDFYDLRIWVNAPRAVRLARGLQRDGEEARSKWVDVWMPAEDRYIADQAPQDHAHLVLDGSGAVDDELGEPLFVLLGSRDCSFR
ncbi:uridine kinase family protein [Candidatus Poriferisocius sp.]|uniref:uridine kinase family protein n=1 Tax=Candidatus Poriferisocius sp. TaxID=3101276 RepID=UPI003B012963